MKILILLFCLVQNFVFAGTIFMGGGGGGTLGLSCSNGQVPEWSSGSFSACLTASGSGTSIGPASSTAHDLVSFKDTGGLNLEDSGILKTAVCTLAATQTITNKTLTGNIAASLSVDGTHTVTFQTANDTIVGRATTDTLINKTLTFPVISTISNGGTVTLFTGSDTVVGRGTTDTLINKTLTSPVLTTPTGFIEQLNGLIASPGNATFIIQPYSMTAGTINSIYIGTSSGTDTVAVKINTTAVTSLSAISVSGTAATSTATGANTFSVGDQISIITSSDSSAVNLYWSLKYTR